MDEQKFQLNFLFLSLLGLHCAQQFEVKPSAVEVNPGDSALLMCKVHNRQGECAWLKDGRVVGRIDTKYEFQREPADGDCSVRIRNAKIEEDDGTWQCQVTQISLTEPTLTAPDVKFTVRGNFYLLMSLFKLVYFVI